MADKEKRRAQAHEGKASPGRPTRLTPELQEEIVSLVRVGNYLETAAGACGVHKSVLLAWLKKGALKRKGRYGEFRDAIMKALDQSQALHVGTIAAAAARGQWKASAFFLTHRFRDQFSPAQRVDNAGHDGGPVPEAPPAVDLRRLTDAELDQYEALLRKAAVATGGGGPAGGGSGEGKA